jgi:hypothetical protein
MFFHGEGENWRKNETGVHLGAKNSILEYADRIKIMGSVYGRLRDPRFSNTSPIQKEVVIFAHTMAFPTEADHITHQRHDGHPQEIHPTKRQ